MVLDKIILLTGATGFVGRALASEVDTKELRLLCRRDPQLANHIFCKANIDGTADFSEYLRDVDVVIHAAARVHVMNETALDPLEEFRKTNVNGTLDLARQSAACGVKRFIFISSIKVNGEAADGISPYRAHDQPLPVDPYGISKMEAEQGLWKLAEETRMEVVIIRPPLVYGPGVKGNFNSMMRWLDKGVPLPLGSIYNKRSLIALDNLIDFVVTCIDHPAAANETFLICDGDDLSTTDLLRRLGHALGRPARLLPVPVRLLTLSAKLMGRGDIADRLCGSLAIDITKARRLLDWFPPVTIDDALRKTAEYYLANKGD